MPKQVEITETTAYATMSDEELMAFINSTLKGLKGEKAEKRLQ